MIRQIFLIFALTFSSSAFALDASYGVTFDGRAYSDTASTVPMLDVISTKIQVLSPSQTCILYEETQSVDTTATSGYFTVQIGSATADGKRTAGDSGNNMRTVFANSVAPISGKLAADGVTPCFYNPVAGDRRFVRIQMTPAGDGITRTISPNMPIDSVPVATVAESIQGIIPSQLLQVNTSGANALSQANLESIFTGSNFSNLTSMMGTSSSNYVKNASNGSLGIPTFSGDPTAPTVGQVWYDSGSGVMKYYDGAVKTFGAAGAGITSLNGLSGAAQTFAVGTTGSDFNISSSGTVHTFNLPSSGAATRGLLSSADWTAFNSKMASNTVFAGDVSGTYNNITLNNTGVSAGNYTKVNVDAKGRVVSGTNLTSADMTGALGYVPVNKAGDTMTGALVVSSTLQVNSAATFSSGTTITSGLNVNAGALNVSGTQLLAGTKVGVGTNNPDASSILDLTSSTLGFLMPRMTTAQRNAVVAPATGLQVYNTDVNLVEFYNGASWVSMTTTATVPAAISNLNGLTSASQTFAVGSTGSDFNIVSSGTVHTYNIPNSSATARGLLSSADWSTFNNKLSNATVFGGDVSGTYNAITLNDTGVSAGNYTKVNVDAKGRVVSGTNLTSADITGTLGYTPVNKAGDTMTGALVVSSTLQVNNAATFSSGTTITSGLNVNAGALNVSGTQLLAGTKIGVGTNSPDASSILDLTSTTLGFLMPRMTTAQRNAVATPANGLQIYNTDTAAIEYYASGTWSSLGVAGAGLQSLNGLTSGTQTFATGTTGSDFNIVSSGTVHTYNIPNSSATARGLLTSADWSTFNNKLSTATVFGGDVSGTYNAITLNDTGVSAGTYNRVTVDVKGRVVSGATTTLNSSDINSFAFVQGGNSFGTTATLGTNDSQNLQFVTSGAGRITVLNNGNVGIGTSSPSQTLTVNGRIETRAGMLFNQGSAATDNLIYLNSASPGPVDGSLGFFAGGLGSTGGSDGAYFLARGNNFTAIPNQRGNIYFAAGEPVAPNATEGSINFMTGTLGVNRLVMLANGSVGIGTTAPSSTLDVNGAFTLRGVTSSTAGLSAGSQGRIYFDSASNKFKVSQNGGAYVDLVTGGSQWSTSGTSVYYNSGNIGIGTSDPVSKLQVVGGGIRLDGNQPIEFGNAGEGIRTDGNPDIKFFSRGNLDFFFDTDNGGNDGFNIFGSQANTASTGAYFTIKPNGKIGMGTDTPNISSILDIASTSAGFLMPRMTTANRNAIGTPATGLQIYNTDNNLVEYYNGSSWVSMGVAGAGLQSLNGLTSGTQTFTIGTSGSDFNIVSSGTVHTYNIPNSSATARGLLTSADWSTFNNKLSTTTVFGGDVSGTYNAITLNDTGVSAGVYSRVNVDAKGRVVSGSTTASPVTSSDVSSFAFVQGGNSFGASATIGTNDSRSLQFVTSNTPQVTILPNGNVGIGTLTPSLPLDIDRPAASLGGGVNAIASFGSSANNKYLYLGYDPSSQTAIIGSDASTLATNLAFWTYDSGASERMRIMGDSGNVGIGTTNPLARLQVGEPGSVSGSVRIAASSTGYVDIRTPATVTSYALTLPSTAGSSGQALTTNGSGTLSWTSMSNASVSGSVNKLAKFTSGIAVGDSILSEVSGSIGVATGSPDWNNYVLDINGQTNFRGTVYADFSYFAKGPSANYLAMSAWDGTNKIYTKDGGGGGNFDILFQPHEVTAMTLKDGGNVGIGTISPSDTLHVVRSASSTFGVKVDSATTSNYSSLAIAKGGIPFGVIGSNASDPNFYITSLYGTSSKLFLGGGSGAANHMTIDGVGNVGIGTVSPTARLQVGEPGSVSGSVRIAASSTGYVDIRTPATVTSYNLTLPSTAGSSGQVLSTNGSGTLGWTSVPSNGGIFLASSGTAAAPGYAFSNDTNTGMYLAANDTLSFATSGSNVVNILPSGRVGIGTASPADTFHVYGPNATFMLQNNGFNGLNIGTGSSGVILGSFGDNGITNSDLVFAADNGTVGGVTERMRISATNGNVGIGTTSPSATLDVNGQVNLRGITSATASLSPTGQGRIYFDSAANKFKVSQNGGAYVDLVVSGGSISGLTAGRVPYASSSTVLTDSAAFTFNNGTKELSVTGSGGTDGNFTVWDATATTYLNITPNWTGGGYISSFEQGNDYRQLTLKSAGLMINSMTGAEAMRVTASGTVGIGTTNPLARLQVGEPGSVSGSVRIAASSTGYVDIRTPATVTSYALTLPSTAGSSGQVLSTNGSGTLNWMNVATNGGTFLAADGTSATPSYSFSSDTNTGMYLAANDTLSFVTSGSNKMTILPSGYVGIGTTAPSAPLDIQVPNGVNLAAKIGSFSVYAKPDWISELAIRGQYGTKNLLYMTEEGTGTGEVTFNVGATPGGSSGDQRVNVIAADGISFGHNEPDLSTPINLSFWDTNDGNQIAAFKVGKDTYPGSRIWFETNNIGGTANSNQLVLAQNGAVGIGTASPSGTFDVNGQFNLRGMASATAGLAPAGQGRIYFDSASNKFRISENNGSYVDLVKSTTVSATGSANRIAMFTAANVLENSPLSVSGTNVGFGTDTNTTVNTLTVSGSGNVTGKFAVGGYYSDDGAKSHQFAVIGNATPGQWHDDVGQFQIRSQSDGEQKQMTFGIHTTSATSYSWIESSHNGSGVRALVLNPDGGPIGINTTSPQAKLQIGEPGTTSATVRLSGGSSGYVELRVPETITSYNFTFPSTAGTNGQVLSTNGSGTLSWTNVAGNGSTFLASSGTATAPGFAFSNDTNTGIFLSANDKLAFATSGTEAAVFDSSGRFGVGTNSPTSRLTVKETARGTMFNILNSSNFEIFAAGSDQGGADYPFLRMTNTDGVNAFSVNGDGNVGPHLWSNARDFSLGDGTNNVYGAGLAIRVPNVVNQENGIFLTNSNGFADKPFSAVTGYTADSGNYGVGGLHFLTSNLANGLTTKMTIEPGGNIGIGTSSTDVAAKVTIKADANPHWSLALTNPGVGGIPWYIGSSNDSWSSGGSKFLISKTTTALASDFTIDGSGNVGIGTVSPTARLQIGEPGSVSGSVRIAASSTGYVDIRTPATVTSYAMTLPSTAGSSGQVLSTNGSGTLSWTSVPSNGGIFLASSGTATAPGYAFSNDTNTGMYLSANDTLNFATSGSSKVAISPAGNMGIGTGAQTISHLLQVGPGDGSVNLTEVKAMITNTGNSGIAVRNSTSNVESFMLVNSSQGEIGTLTNHPFYISTNNANRISILNNGYVGIGTNSPTAKLNVSGDTLLSGRLGVGASPTSVAGYTSKFTTAGAGNVDWMGVFSAYSNNVDAPSVAFTKSRNGTIGSHTATQNGDYLGSLYFYGSDGTAYREGAKIEVAVDAAPGASDMPGRIGFFTTPDGSATSVERMRITSDGNVGIGKQNPTDPLSVQWDHNGYTDISVYNMSASGSAQVALAGYTDAGWINWGLHSLAGGGNAYLWNNANSAIEFATNNTEKMRLTAGGNLGIGTTSPVALLQVGEPGTVSGSVRIAASSTGYVDIRTPATVTSYAMTLPSTAGTSGQVLSTNGSGTLSWVSAATNGGTFLAADGTSATPSYAFSNDTNTGMYLKAADTLSFSTSGSDKVTILPSGYVGVGTTSPSFPFVLVNNGGNSSGEHTLGWFTNTTGAGDAGVKLGYYADGSNPTAGYIRSTNSLPLYLGTNTSQPSVAVNNNGNLIVTGGIPSNTSTIPLSITKDGYTMGGAGSRRGVAMFDNAAGDNGIILGYDVSGTIGVVAADAGAGGSSNLAFVTRNSGTFGEKMRLDNNGNLGIGTTNPVARLQVGEPGTVSGSVRIAASSTGYVDIRTPATVTSYAMTLPSTAGSSGQVLSTNGSGTLSWTSVPSSGGIFLASSGTAASPGYAFSSDSNTGMYLAANDTLSFATSGSERVRIDSSGLVGINTTNLQTLLNVGGGSGTPFDGASKMPVYIAQADDTAISIENTANGVETGVGTFSSYGYVGALTNNPFYILTNDSPKLVVSAAGNVGIGTTTPLARLQVGEPGTVSGSVRIAASSTGYVDIRTPATVTSYAMTLPSTAGSSGQALTTNGSGTLSWTSVATNGGTFLAANGSATSPSYSFSNDSNTGMYLAANDTLTFATSGAERVRITSAGYLGIGTNNPVRPLDVVGSYGSDMLVNLQNTDSSGVTGIRYLDNTGGIGAMVGYWNTSAPGYSGVAGFVTNTADIQLITGDTGAVAGTPRLVVKGTSGNIGIGTTAPSATVHIEGGLTLTGSTMAANNGSNKIFIPNYAYGAWQGSMYTIMDAASDYTAGAYWAWDKRASFHSPTYALMSPDGNNTLGTTWEGSNTIGYLKSSQALGFKVAATNGGSDVGSEAMRITTGGNIGVGTTNPLARLQVGEPGTVSGSVRIAASSTGYVDIRTPATVTSYAMTLPSTAGSSGQALTTNGSGTLSWTSVAGTGSTFLAANGSATAPGFAFSNDTNTGMYLSANDTISFATSGSEKVKINGSGYLGIGTSSPTALFHMYDPGIGNLKIGPSPYEDVSYDGGGDEAFWFGNTGSSAGRTSFTRGGTYTEILTIGNWGQVGIMNSSPARALHIGNAGTTSGTIRIAGGTSGYVDILVPEAAGSWSMMLPSTAGSSNQVLATNGSGILSWLTVPISGGIFTATSGTASAPSFTFSGDTNTGIYSAAADTITFTTSGTEKMRVTAQGNVGIGTTPSTNAKLDVNGQIKGGFLSHSSLNTDWSVGNIQLTSVASGTLTFTSGSMYDGASYVLILTNTGTFTLSTAGDITTWKCLPACASNQITATGHTVLTIIKAGTTGYLSWGAGYQ